MIPEIQRQLTPAILEKAATAFGVAAEALNPIGGFESYVYGYQKNNKSYILKLTHTLRRHVNYIMGEINYLLYLDAQGVSVSVSNHSLNGQYIEAIPAENGDFLAISYIKADGHAAKKEDWNEKLFTKWGQTMGKIHRVTGAYSPSKTEYRRQNWQDEDQLNAKKYVSYDKEFIAKMDDLLESLEALPKLPTTYGLVHEDFHPGNFFITEDGKLTLFDFDDCSYTYFINDISIAMYYATQYPLIPFKNESEEIEFLFRSFMKGYFREHSLDKAEFSLVNRLIQLRHAMNYVIFHQTNDVMKLGDEGKALLAEHRSQVLSDEPFVRVDFEAIVSNLF